MHFNDSQLCKSDNINIRCSIKSDIAKDFEEIKYNNLVRLVWHALRCPCFMTTYNLKDISFSQPSLHGLFQILENEEINTFSKSNLSLIIGLNFIIKGAFLCK